MPKPLAALGRLAPRADASTIEVEHLRRSDRLDYDSYARWVADSHLWHTPRPRRVMVERNHMPAPVAVAAEFPVQLIRLPAEPGELDATALCFPPLSLIRLSSQLSDRGHPVQILDLQPELADLNGERLGHAAERIIVASASASPPRLLGLSAETPGAIAFARQLLQRGVQGSAHTVLGGRGLGGGGGVDALEACHSLDFVIEGEGELPLAALATALALGHEPRAIPGLCQRSGGRVIRQPGAWHDMELYAPPDLAGFDSSIYRGGGGQGRLAFGDEPFVPYMFVEGCPYRCAFCGDRGGALVRTRRPDLVLRDWEQMVDRHDVRNLLVLNTLVNANPPYLRELLRVLLPRGLPLRWADSAKAHQLEFEDLKALRQVGCFMLTWGIDTGSQRLSKLVHKGIDLDEAAQILRWSHRAGIRNVVNLIQGLPHENDADIASTEAWLRRNAASIWRVNVHCYRFLPSSQLYQESARYGLRRRSGEDGGGFDEVGGLRWQDKLVQIDRSHERVARVSCELGLGDGV